MFAARRKRVFEHLLWRSLLFYQALVEEHHFTGDLTGEAHFVGHEQHGAAFFGQRADDIKYFLDHFRVKRRGGLVEQDDLGLHGQGAGDGRALLLAAGQLRRVGMALVGDADLGQQGFGHFDGFGLALAEHAARGFDDVVEHTHVRPQIKVLKHKTDFAAQAIDLLAVGGHQFTVLRGLELEFFAGDQNLALVRVLQQVDAPQERGLAGAGGTQDRDHIAVAGGQRDALEHLQRAVAFVQVADFKRGRGLSHVRSSYMLRSCCWRPSWRGGQPSIAFQWQPTALRTVNGWCVAGCRIGAADCRPINNRTAV
ncbi:hypothetical protein D3C76_856680 [compost metagenome]